MKLLSVLAKSLREMRRDLLVLSLSLVFAPFFVFLYWLLFPSGSTAYGVLVINDDRPVAGDVTLSGGEDLVKALQGVAYKNGNPLLKVSRVTDRAEAEAHLRNRDAALLVIIPADFSQALHAARSGSQTVTTTVTFVGDLTNPYYTVAAVLSMGVADQAIQAATGQPRPIQLDEVPLGASAARSEFENYVPGLMVFAVVMLVFPAAMTVAREVESGALRRLQLTRMTALDLLGGISASLVLIGAASVILTCLTAWALGFRSEGRWWVAILVGAVTSLSVIGVGLVVASFSRTVTQAFLIANFPLGFFMFFSGTAFPIPRVPLFTLAGRDVGLYDILPPTHAVVALNKVLTLGAGLGDVLYELAALLLLSLVYFAAGVWLFQRTHLKAG